MTTIEKLVKFVNQRSGIDPHNYYSDWRDTEGIKAYRSETREITKDRSDFFELLSLAQRRINDLETKLTYNLTHSNGRLVLLPSGELEYTTGQYFPTEYRPAANRIIAQLIWNDYMNEEQDTKTNGMQSVYKDGHEIRKALRNTGLSRRVMKNYFN
jgi:hypothetical protein